MGLPIERSEFSAEEFAAFGERLGDSIDLLRSLLERPGFGEGPRTLGAELEVSIVDKGGRPLTVDRRDLRAQLDPQITLELDRFNLEYNLEPLAMPEEPFRQLETQLAAATARLGALVEPLGGRVVPIGILPTLRSEDLLSHAMTDLPRYRALSASLRRLRPDPFQVVISGEESLTQVCDDVTLEGAATSFQVHLRVAPEEFADLYNAAQLATPVALAVSGNSPIFVERRLWEETRIALFKQAVDDRVREHSDWRPPARVSFGHGWVRRGALELFAESVALFPPLLPVCAERPPHENLHANGIPALEELRLHQGTVWRWNRAIFDPSAGGHLRIELRSLPSGPTPIDMSANAALLLGLTLGLAGRGETWMTAFPFEYVSHSFYRAAQRGLEAELLWPPDAPPAPRVVGARQLLRELLPLAAEGLESAGVDAGEVARVLGVIRDRLESGMTPSRWQSAVLEALGRQGLGRREALREMLEVYLARLETGAPVHEWSARP